jgi:hypothetical protein
MQPATAGCHLSPAGFQSACFCELGTMQQQGIQPRNPVGSCVVNLSACIATSPALFLQQWSKNKEF